MMKKIFPCLLILVLLGSAVNFGFDVAQVSAEDKLKKDSEKWEFIVNTEFKEEAVYNASLSKSEKIAALGLQDGRVIIWDIEKNEIINTLKKSNKIITNVDFSSTNDKLIFSSLDNNILRIWNLNNNNFDKDITFEGAIGEVEYIPNTDNVILQLNNSVIVVDLEDKSIIKRFSLTKKSGINSISVSETGKYIAAAGDEVINIWNLSSGELHNTIEWEIGGGTRIPGIKTIDLSNKKELVAAGGPPSQVKIWNMNTGEIVSEISVSNYYDSVTSMKFSPKVKNLIFTVGKWGSVNSPATKEKNGLINIFNIKSNSVVKKIKTFNPVLTVDFSKVNNNLIFGTDNGNNDKGLAEIWSR